MSFLGPQVSKTASNSVLLRVHRDPIETPWSRWALELPLDEVSNSFKQRALFWCIETPSRPPGLDELSMSVLLEDRKMAFNSNIFHKVKLRGHVFKFNPTLINKHYGFRDEGATGATLKLGDIIEELTGKTLIVWPTKEPLQASHLSLRYPVLHKAFIANLVPTSNNTNVSEALGRMLYVMGTEHVLNVGKIIFDQIVDHAKTGAKLKPIDFPSLVYSLLITQHPTVLKKEDGLEEDAKPLTISDKLMKGKHVLDVEFNVADQPEPVPEGEAAGMLLKVYEEKFLRVESEIQANTVLAYKYTQSNSCGNLA